MAAVPFVQWVTTPQLHLLYAGLDDRRARQVTTELEGSAGVPYQLEGSRVLVPQDQLHRVRANLAQAGVSATPTVPGYELLDEQALGVSDFRQRVDLQRAVEGELSRTLRRWTPSSPRPSGWCSPRSRCSPSSADPGHRVGAVRPTRSSTGQIEAITLLVSSAVEGLETDQITVADTAGQVLHAPGDGRPAASPTGSSAAPASSSRRSPPT
jgi:flagellar M-ring protein FliF